MLLNTWPRFLPRPSGRSLTRARRERVRRSPDRIAPIVAQLEDRTLLTAWGLDPTFGTAGKVTTALGTGSSAGFATALQSDGKVVVVGQSFDGTTNDFTVARYNTDGTLDTSFGANQSGFVQTPIGSSSRAFGVAIDSNGDIVVAGWAVVSGQREFAVVRYTPDGQPDSTFGTNGNGIVTTQLEPGDNSDAAFAVAVQSDNEILAGGLATAGATNQFALVRYTAGGTLDPTFGSGGVVETPIGTNADADALAIQADPSGDPSLEKIILAGESNNGSGYEATVVRYDASGGLDGTFGTNGVATAAIGSDADIYSVALQSDGAIVAAGDNDNGLFAARFDGTGNLDTSFNASGSTPGAFTLGGFDGNAVALQSDGKIIVGGDDGSNFALLRFNSDGTLDTSFDTSATGIITTSFAAPSYINGLAIQSDGGIVAAGQVHTGSPYDFALARYEPLVARVSVSDAGGTYDGNQFAATATLLGVDGVTPVNGSFTFTYYVGSTVSGPG